MRDEQPAAGAPHEPAECLICLQRHYEPMFDGHTINGHRLFRCCECGTAIAVEARNLAEARADYTEYGDYLVHQERAEIDLALSGEARAKDDLFEMVERRFPRPRLLELGSGAGYFCRVAADRGWRAMGVEPSAKLREYSRRVIGFEQVVEDLSEVSGPFDVVAMFDVIEHLQPSVSRNSLASLTSDLVENGYLVGNTPNLRSLNITLSGRREPVIAPPHHVLYFTPESLDRYLTGFGLRRVQLVTGGFNHTQVSGWCVEQGGSVVGPLLGSIARNVGRVAGFLASPRGRGYQIHFVYDKITQHGDTGGG